MRKNELHDTITWNRVLTDGQILANGSNLTPMMVQIFEFNKLSKEQNFKCISSFYKFNFMNMKETVFTEAFSAQKDLKLTISNYDTVNSFSFLEYITGGCEIDLHVAINFNQTNGNQKNKNSFHFVGKD